MYTDTDKKNSNQQSKIYHIFFDVDSTLTHTGIHTLDKEVKEAFELFKKRKCRLYFCTGRSPSDVKTLIDKYELKHGYGIAEAGGIIIGAGPARLGYYRFGKRTEAVWKVDTTTNSGQYTRIDINNTAAASYATNSNLSVLGTD